jgi:hypothetical protein
MNRIVLLAVAAAWAAVLVPPLLRSRLENRPGSSVSDFRRQLSTLQKSVPTRQMAPMRGMARPLTHASSARPSAATRRAAQAYSPLATDERYVVDAAPTGGLERRPAYDPTGATRRAPARRVSRREVIRRRRANVLFLLVATTGLALFLAATTSSSFWVYVFAASFVALCGYVYKLAQLRQYELDSRHPDIRHADVRW